MKKYRYTIIVIAILEAIFVTIIIIKINNKFKQDMEKVDQDELVAKITTDLPDLNEVRTATHRELLRANLVTSLRFRERTIISINPTNIGNVDINVENYDYVDLDLLNSPVGSYIANFLNIADGETILMGIRFRIGSYFSNNAAFKFKGRQDIFDSVDGAKTDDYRWYRVTNASQMLPLYLEELSTDYIQGLVDVETLYLTANENINVGSPTGTVGTGDINISGNYYINGVAISSGFEIKSMSKYYSGIGTVVTFNATETAAAGYSFANSIILRAELLKDSDGGKYGLSLLIGALPGETVQVQQITADGVVTVFFVNQ